ncbi:MAG: squalene--hopene cyclase [Planctomycetes bacterium]|nr:squalene--hopene cyclase [Planctomycetota bacterium]
MPATVANRDALARTLRQARGRLAAARTAAGHWAGELSSSALSTATATFALAMAERAGDRHGAAPSRSRLCSAAARGNLAHLVRRGLDWLAANQNEDGGWGDTDLSRSNLSTTALVWAAFAASPGPFDGGAGGPRGGSGDPPRTANGPSSGAAGAAGAEARLRAVAGAEAWLRRRAGSLEPERLAAAIAARYGRDRTFSAPILTMLALAGRLGPPERSWRLVPALPFELAACPHRLLGWLRLPVVSYALPALVAVGQVRHHFRPTRNPAARALRAALRGRTLAVLRSIQPPSGGYLEATPLTSFVTMSLIGAGLAEHPVVQDGLAFLAASARPDGSWPIDTNLATWVTTLSVGALASAPDFAQVVPADARRTILEWLLAQQHAAEHPYTHAAPGGWAWTDLPGGVPDADDTAGALVALAHLAADLGAEDEAARRAGNAAARGVRWLLDLQNRDGGIPTFCRGWGTLPFDRSSPDLAAHALRAWGAWHDRLPADLRPRVRAAAGRAAAYLERTQTADGAWVPLWFGNQWDAREENPLYGTARVVTALAQAAAAEQSRDRKGAVPWRLPARGQAAARCLARGVGWLLAAQNWAGAWGGSPAARASIEETALALEALAAALTSAAGAGADLPHASIRTALARGTAWLIERTEEGSRFPAAPIGLYFAKLWYYERLYPLIFTVAALERVRQAEGL